MATPSYLSVSEHELERFITAANENPDSDPDWVNNFCTVKSIPTPTPNSCPITRESSLPAVEEQINAEATVEEDVWENIINIIRNDLENRFNEVVTECLKNPFILDTLGDRLEESVLDQFIRFILEVKCDLSNDFLTDVYKRLLPTLLVTSSSHKKHIIELLVIAFHANPDKFKLSVVPKLISDVPVNILVAFSKKIKPNQRSIILHGIMENTLIEAPYQLIEAVFELYKENEDPQVHNYILELLTKCAMGCRSDKTYGLLLLMFIKNQKSNLNYEFLERLVEYHRSVFQKMCKRALEKLI